MRNTLFQGPNATLLQAHANKNDPALLAKDREFPDEGDTPYVPYRGPKREKYRTVYKDPHKTTRFSQNKPLPVEELKL